MRGTPTKVADLPDWNDVVELREKLRRSRTRLQQREVEMHEAVLKLGGARTHLRERGDKR